MAGEANGAPNEVTPRDHTRPSPVSVLRAVAAWVALAVLFGAPAGARAAATIALDGLPTPPQGVVLGDPGGIAYTIVAAPAPSSVEVSLTDPTGKVVFQQAPNVGAVPISGQVPFPGAERAPGRYTITVNVFDQPGGPPEAVASGAFDAAPALGSLQLVQYEDLNANGVRDPDEPGLPGRQFDLTSPFGTTSTASTGADGGVGLAGVPTGTWQVAASAPPPWVPVGAAAARVPVGPALAGGFSAGSARPGSIGGGVFDLTGGGRTPLRGVALTLVGTDGLGRPVSARVVVGPGGDYAFPDLLPGTYVVTAETLPGLVGATPLASGTIVLTSGLASLGHDFGLVAIPGPPPVALPGGAGPAGPAPPPGVSPSRPSGVAVPKALRRLQRRARLLHPAAGAGLVTVRPLLRWARGPEQTVGYNLQVWEYPRLRRVLSAFPTRPAFRIRAGFLSPGRSYVWRAWPYLSSSRYTRAPVGVSFFQILPGAGR
jgi:hypothetical protein